MNTLEQIRIDSEDRLIVTPVGVGSAFASQTNSSFILAYHGKTILVDCGANVPDALKSDGINIADFDAYYITHTHPDHCYGFGEVLFAARYMAKKRVKLLAPEPILTPLWEETLKGGLYKAEFPYLNLDDYAEIIRMERQECDPTSYRECYGIEWEGFKLLAFQTKHTPGGPPPRGLAKMSQYYMWSSGLLVNEELFISGDTQFDPALIVAFASEQNIVILHDCQFEGKGLVHASVEELCSLPAEVKRRMYLYHYSDMQLAKLVGPVGADQPTWPRVEQWCEEKGFAGVLVVGEALERPDDTDL